MRQVQSVVKSAWQAVSSFIERESQNTDGVGLLTTCGPLLLVKALQALIALAEHSAIYIDSINVPVSPCSSFL